MNIAMFRVGIDTGSGGIHGPIFSNGEFEFIPIIGEDNKYTYGNMDGRYKRKLIDYFPKTMQKTMHDTQIHYDPEFETFTYGDPNKGKQKLADRLQNGDLVIFYAGLKGWGGSDCPPAIYIIGYFVISIAIHARNYDDEFIHEHFKNNAHVRNVGRYRKDKPTLILIKGNKEKSRLFKKAVCISEKHNNAKSQPEDCLSLDMRKIFGQWGKLSSLKRNPTHWIKAEFIDKAYEFVTSQS